MATKVYALSTCPYCKMARKYLEENDVPFDVVEVDLLTGTEREEAVAQVKRLSGGTSFPVIEVDGEVIVGFNKPKMQKLLHL
jgi:Glutaredoxin and related proteins